MSEQFAVAIVQDFDGWIVEADSAEAALAIVRGTVPEAAEVEPCELRVWTVAEYLARYGAGFNAEAVFQGWTVL